MNSDVDWRVVFESHDAASCNEHSLVLTSVQIPHQLIHDQAGFALVVPAEYSGTALRELRQYEHENPPPISKPRRAASWHDATPGLMGYVGTLLLVAWLAAIAAFSINWFAVGRVDGELIRAGQWWRLFTALTLHADLAHLLGNIVFGTFFGLFAGRLLGSGVAWLAVALSAGLGNLLNVLVLESAHRSIGASTAVFAALGLVAGYVWHAKLMSQERWVYRLGPIVGGIALLAYTGMGGGEENVDVGAHVMGFISGFGCGIVLVHLMRRLGSGRIQLYAGMLALACIVVPWLAGLSTSHASS